MIDIEIILTRCQHYIARNLSISIRTWRAWKPTVTLVLATTVGREGYWINEATVPLLPSRFLLVLFSLHLRSSYLTLPPSLLTLHFLSPRLSKASWVPQIEIAGVLMLEFEPLMRVVSRRLVLWRRIRFDTRMISIWRIVLVLRGLRRWTFCDGVEGGRGIAVGVPLRKCGGLSRTRERGCCFWCFLDPILWLMGAGSKLRVIQSQCSQSEWWDIRIVVLVVSHSSTNRARILHPIRKWNLRLVSSHCKSHNEP